MAQIQSSNDTGFWITVTVNSPDLLQNYFKVEFLLFTEEMSKEHKA